MKRNKVLISISIIAVLSMAVGLTASTAQAPLPPAQPDVELGEPGLSYRFIETLGETGVPYFEDSDHINYPWGVGTDGENLWIGEERGGRALKFTSIRSNQPSA